MTVDQLLDVLRRRGVRLAAGGGGRIRCRPATALDQFLIQEIIHHKVELLRLLCEGRGDTNGDGHADREWRRFWSVAKPWPDGSGWYDPQAMTPALFKWLNNSSNNS